MSFGVRYYTATGAIDSTMMPATPDEQVLPKGIAQLVFPEYVETQEMKVDLVTKTLVQDFSSVAYRALKKSDEQVIRCYENGTPFPQNWKEYRNQLRAIVSYRAVGPLPDAPPYP